MRTTQEGIEESALEIQQAVIHIIGYAVLSRVEVGDEILQLVDTIRGAVVSLQQHIVGSLETRAVKGQEFAQKAYEAGKKFFPTDVMPMLMGGGLYVVTNSGGLFKYDGADSFDWCDPDTHTTYEKELLREGMKEHITISTQLKQQREAQAAAIVEAPPSSDSPEVH